MDQNLQNVEYEKSITDYIEILRRRVWVILLTFVVIISVTGTLAILLPPVYQSSGTILIESQQISTDIIASSVTGLAAERIEVIKQRVMTRENLFRIIKKYNLFQDALKSRVTSDIIEDFRDRINIKLLSSDMGNRRRKKTTIAFSIAFEDRYADVAYKVTNELVTLFLDENVKSRVERASETTEFLKQEAKRLKVNLEEIESQVAEYKQENAASLPENLTLKTSILQRAEISLAELDRDYKATENELKRLKLELSAAESGIDVIETPTYRLKQLKSEYSKALVNYKETHPTVRKLKNQIDNIEKSIAEQPESLDGENNAANENIVIDNDLVLKLKTLVKTANGRLESIDEQRKAMRKKISRLEREILQTPQVELGLSTLLRDHGNAKRKYEEIQAKQLSAQIAENLEGENKSERFTLIDPPLLADKPVKPNRIKILLIGFFLAISGSIGLAILLEIMNHKIRGKTELTTLLGETPLVEIPYIQNIEEIAKKKRLYKRSIIAAVSAVVLVLIAVQVLYMDLQLLFYKIMARF